MKFTEFLTAYAGKKVDFDGAYGAQCVDLFRQYHKDVIGGEHTGVVTGAVELWTKFTDSRLPEYYNRNTIAVMEPGDVVIFDATEKNRYGHVALFVGYIPDGIIVFEQDGFKKDGAKFTVWNKDRILGILKPKNGIEI